MTANVASSGVCQPGACERKLNAAPLLNTSTRLKKPVSSRRSPGANAPSTLHLTSWSATTIAAATMNQRADLGIGSFLARTFEVGYAASAEARVVHVGAIVPAALAFRMHAGSHIDAARCPVRSPAKSGTGRDERKPQIVSEPRQRLIQGAGSADVHFRLQR